MLNKDAFKNSLSPTTHPPPHGLVTATLLGGGWPPPWGPGPGRWDPRTGPSHTWEVAASAQQPKCPGRMMDEQCMASHTGPPASRWPVHPGQLRWPTPCRVRSTDVRAGGRQPLSPGPQLWPTGLGRAWELRFGEGLQVILPPSAPYLSSPGRQEAAQGVGVPEFLVRILGHWLPPRFQAGFPRVIAWDSWMSPPLPPTPANQANHSLCGRCWITRQLVPCKGSATLTRSWGKGDQPRGLAQAGRAGGPGLGVSHP